MTIYIRQYNIYKRRPRNSTKFRVACLVEFAHGKWYLSTKDCELLSFVGDKHRFYTEPPQHPEYKYVKVLNI
jgi:hypothetical protein